MDGGVFHSFPLLYTEMNPDYLFSNGINGATGEYLLPPILPENLSQLILSERIDPDELDELKAKHEHDKRIRLGPVEGIDVKKLAETGWGVIFAHDADPAIQEALRELLQYRKKQATAKHEHYYKEYAGADGYRPDESKIDFLARHGAGPGPADPENVPYYLLIVGSPESIPFPFQFQLDVQYAVGRICFDTPEEYARYARSVIAAEAGEVSLPQRAVFFGVENEDDPATSMSANHLVQPLADYLQKDQPDWLVETILQDEAKKATLSRLLAEKEPPALLFTASHGMGFTCGDPRQLKYQGALLCQDWPGPEKWRKPIPQDFYFSCEDVQDDARLDGMITFHFACYGAGTPRLDDFAHANSSLRKTIAPHAFLASLPQRMLSRGALAIVGHVERVWGYSFAWTGAGRQLGTFTSAFKRLMEGHTVGSAIEFFNKRYAELSSDLSVQIQDIRFKKKDSRYREKIDDFKLCNMWTANNDARSYSVMGDPAVKLPVKDLLS